MSKFDNMLGFISALAFAFMAVPSIVNVVQTGDSNSITIGFLVLNYIGNIFAFTYVLRSNLKTRKFQYPLYFNYTVATVNLVVLTILKVTL